MLDQSQAWTFQNSLQRFDIWRRSHTTLLRLLAWSIAIPMAYSFTALLILRNVEEATSLGLKGGCYPGSADEVSRNACDIQSGIPTLVLIAAITAVLPAGYVLLQWLLVKVAALHRTMFAIALPVLISLGFIASAIITLICCALLLSVLSLVDLSLTGAYHSYTTAMVLGAMMGSVWRHAWTLRPGRRHKQVRHLVNTTDAAIPPTLLSRIGHVARQHAASDPDILANASRLTVHISPWNLDALPSSPGALHVSRNWLKHLTLDELDALITRALCDVRVWNPGQRHKIASLLGRLNNRVYRFAYRAFFDAPAAAILTELHRASATSYAHLTRLHHFEVDKAASSLTPTPSLARAMLKPAILALLRGQAIEEAYRAFDIGLIIRNLETWTERRIVHEDPNFVGPDGLAKLADAMKTSSAPPHIFDDSPPLEIRLLKLKTSPADVTPILLNLGQQSAAAELGLTEDFQHQNQYVGYDARMHLIEEEDYWSPSSDDERHMRLRHALAYVAAASATALGAIHPEQARDADQALLAYLLTHPEDVPEAEQLTALLGALLDAVQLQTVANVLDKLSENENFGRAFDIRREFELLATQRAMQLPESEITP